MSTSIPFTMIDDNNSFGENAPILLDRGTAKESRLLPLDADSAQSEDENHLAGSEDNSIAVRRALAQARAKCGPIVLIRKETEQESDSEESAPELAGESDSTDSSDSESDAEQQPLIRPSFAALRSMAASAPAHVQKFPSAKELQEKQAAAPSGQGDLVEEYRAMVVRDDSQVKPTRSSTYWTRKDAAIQWIKSQWAVQEEQKTESSPAPTPAPAPAPISLASAKPRTMLSAMSPDEQKAAMEARKFTGSSSFTARRASKQPGLATKLPKLGKGSFGDTLKVEASEPTVTRIAPSPGSPSLGWSGAISALRSVVPTPRSAFVAKCGKFEIRITPPTPRAAGFNAKVPGVVLRHTFAPPPGSIRFVPGSPKVFADQPSLTPPPFDVAPGRNMILQRRAEAHLEELKEMARQQLASQGLTLSDAAANAQIAAMTANAVAQRRLNSNRNASSTGSPRQAPGSPQPKRLDDRPNRIDSPPSPRAKPIYVAPGKNGYRSGQLDERSAQQVNWGKVPKSAAVDRTFERKEAGRTMLNRLGQRNATPPKSACI